MRKLTVLILFALLLGLAACGGSDSGSASSSGGSSSGNAGAGEDLFNKKLVGTQPGCVTCHSLEADVVMVGPSLHGIGSRAGSTVDGESAEEYIKTSIMDPDAHVVDGFDAGTMPIALSDELDDGQVNDLVAFLLTQ